MRPAVSSKWALSPRPSVAWRRSDWATASSAGWGTGPFEPAFRYASRSSTGKWARRSSTAAGY